MKRWKIALLAVVLVIGAWLLLRSQAPWAGADQVVVEKFAAQAGRHATRPLINTTQGDVMLFAFVVAGMTGGFLAGWYGRELFGPGESAAETDDV